MPAAGNIRKLPAKNIMQPQRALTLCFFVAACLQACVLGLPSCKARIQGVDYDLSPLRMSPDAPYTVQDYRDRSTNYTFNVCDDVSASSLPQTVQIIPRRQSVPAFQIQSTNNVGYQLSGPADLGWNFSLLGMMEFQMTTPKKA